MPYPFRRRQSHRLSGHDYSWPGAYFLTLCAHRRECLFGTVSDGEMRLSRIGEIVEVEWKRSFEVRQEMELDLWTLMPNHLHALVLLTHDRASPRRAGPRPVRPDMWGTGRPSGPVPRSISSLVAGFKVASAARVNELRGTRGAPLWQRDFYEHVVRDGRELQGIRQYIVDNPRLWAEDEENVEAWLRRG